jgi:hypothetical protein
MSIQKTITLTDKGVNSGPTYTLSYSSDCVEYTSSVNVTLSSISSSVVVNVPENTQCIKLTSIGDCTNEVIQNITTTTTTTIAPPPTTTTTTTLGTTTTTTTITPSNYVVDIYDEECNNIDTVVISNSMALVIAKFYGTNELDGPVINVISLTAATPDFFTNITVGPYNTCPDVPPL